MVLGFDWTQILVALFGGLLGAPVFAYLAKRFLFSGRAQLPPQELWKEATLMRALLEKENERLRKEFQEATDDVFDLRGRVLSLGAKLDRARADLGRLRPDGRGKQ